MERPRPEEAERGRVEGDEWKVGGEKGAVSRREGAAARRRQRRGPEPRGGDRIAIWLGIGGTL